VTAPLRQRWNEREFRPGLRRHDARRGRGHRQCCVRTAESRKVTSLASGAGTSSSRLCSLDHRSARLSEKICGSAFRQTPASALPSECKLRRENIADCGEMGRFGGGLSPAPFTECPVPISRAVNLGLYNRPAMLSCHRSLLPLGPRSRPSASHPLQTFKLTHHWAASWISAETLLLPERRPPW